MPILEYAIVAGLNGTPVNIETISVAGATALSTVMKRLDSGTHFFVSSLGNYDASYQFTPSGIIQNGYAVQTWRFPVVSTLAYAYFIANYAQDSSQNGKCTVNTRLNTETYVERNAIVYAPYPNTLVPKIHDALWVYEDVDVSIRIIGETV